MNITDTCHGVMILCDDQGQLIQVIRDDFGLCGADRRIQRLTDLVDHDSREKAAAFVAEVVRKKAAFGWEMNVFVGNRLSAAHFAGGATTDGLLLIGSLSRTGVMQFMEELMRINNEQSTALRAAAKAQALQGSGLDEQTEVLLNDLARLNNELANAQRDAARRNHELSRANAELERTRGLLETEHARLVEANERLEALATTDGLTGAKNHRAFQERLSEEYSRASRSGAPLSVILLDVDNFKLYNDEFGHPAGDRVLKSVAQLLQANVREVDYVARYGGEEFAIVLPGADDFVARSVAERCREAIAAGPWPDRQVTASLGVASANASTPSRGALIEQADTALYRSKAAGRNRVSLYFDLTVS